jgi:Mg-chelatase subunit ChlD
MYQHTQQGKGPWAVRGESIGYIGFADEAEVKLPLVSVNYPAALSSPIGLQAGGQTNLTAALDLANAMLHGAPQGAVKRLVVISDGYPNLKTESLIRAACACREAFISLDVVFIGEDPDAAELMRHVSCSTVNGRFIRADELAAIRRAVVSAEPLPHKRVGATVVAIDTSGSMSEPLRGTTTTRLQAAVRAAIDLAVTKRVAYGRQPAGVRL